MQPAHKQYTSILSNRHLHSLGVATAVALWVLLTTLHLTIHSDTFTLGETLLDLAVILLGATIFWTWAGRRLRQREAQIGRHVEQLQALHEAALALSAELDLDTVLQRVVDLSRSLVGAHYGALSVLAEDGECLEAFVTSGFSSAQLAQIGPLPRGDGLLALPIRERRPISIPDLTRDARATGFPPHHPPMHSLLAVPIIAKGKGIGSLFLADKLAVDDSDEAVSTCFSLQDQDLLVMFATQAAIAIENARLYHQAEQVAILQERERFSRNLHDGIIQSLYAIGLLLEDGHHRIETEPQLVRERIARVIHDLNDVILDMRSYILGLRPPRFQAPDLSTGLTALVHDLRIDTFLNVGLEMASLAPGTLSAGQTAEILHVAQEALANVHRHALATQVQVSLQCQDNQLLLTVADNGVGFALDSVAVTGGLHNMHERARILNGQLQIDSTEGGGTCVHLTVPL